LAEAALAASALHWDGGIQDFSGLVHEAGGGMVRHD
jgi:hypothetical protein